MVRVAIIVVAGGSGTRMSCADTSLPKQFLSLHGKPILIRTIERFADALPEAQIVVALPDAQIEHWHTLCEQYGMTHSHKVCKGGQSRFDSVKSALGVVADCDFVAVHDGVRPLLSSKLIVDTLATARKYGTAIPVTEPADSFRVVELGSEALENSPSKPLDRNTLRAVQTPQFFRYDTLLRAYKVDYDPSFTDDASVVERSGVEVTLCRGERDNIKITTPSDLLIAEALMAKIEKGLSENREGEK